MYPNSKINIKIIYLKTIIFNDISSYLRINMDFIDINYFLICLNYFLLQLCGIVVTLIVILFAWYMIYKIVLRRFPLFREILGQKIT